MAIAGNLGMYRFCTLSTELSTCLYSFEMIEKVVKKAKNGEIGRQSHAVVIITDVFASKKHVSG